MWVIKIPQRPDFCGQPPCPLCYDWAEDNGVDNTVQEGLERFSLDLLGKKLADTTEAEFEQLKKLGCDIHMQKVDLAPNIPEQLPPAQSILEGETSDEEWLNRWLREHRGTETKPERQLTIDEIADRKVARKRAKTERKERVKELVSEISEAVEEVKKEEKAATAKKDPLQEAQRGAAEMAEAKARWLERQGLKGKDCERWKDRDLVTTRDYEFKGLEQQYGIPSGFVNESKRKGLSPRQTLEKWAANTRGIERYPSFDQLYGSSANWVSFDPIKDPLKLG